MHSLLVPVDIVRFIEKQTKDIYITIMLTKNDLNLITKIVKTSEERINKKIDRIDRKLDKAINFLDTKA